MLGTVVGSDSALERPSHSCRTVGTRGGPGELCSAVSPERVMNPTGTRPPGPEHRAPDEQPVPRVVSYGGGVQSNALLELAAQGRIDYRTFLFANVGDDSEHGGPSRNDADEAGMGGVDPGGGGGGPRGQGGVLLPHVGVSWGDHA